MSAAKAKKKSKQASTTTKRKFKPKVVTPPTEDDFDFSSLLDDEIVKVPQAGKPPKKVTLKISEEFFTCEEENEDRITARIYIDLPEEFKDVVTPHGLPCGHVIHTIGESDTGKTTFALECVKRTQHAGGLALYANTERKFDMTRAVTMGVDRRNMIMYKPGYIEDLFDKGKIVIKRFRDKFPDRPAIWIWDSVSATPSLHEYLDKAQHNMKNANAISGELRRARGFFDDYDVCFLIVNRVYEKQTTMPGEKKTKSYGGKSPKGLASIELEFSRKKRLVNKRVIDGKEIKLRLGIEAQIDNTKNHLAPPFNSALFNIDRYGFVLGGRKVKA